MSVPSISVRFALAVAVLTCANIAKAQDSYPRKPIQIVVPYAAGGVNDVLARLMAKELSESLRNPVVVENRPGATGIVGSEYVKKSEPDGHTLLQGATGPSAANAALYSKLSYDPVKDFAPVALIGTTPFVLYVNSKLPVKSVKELIELSKAKPGTLNYGVGASVHQLGMELLKAKTGADITYVAYKGGTPALTDVMGGQIQVGYDGIQTPLPAIRQGTVRALAISSSVRASALPGTPTVIESGVADYDLVGWSALFAPAGTPASILDRLHGEIAKILQKPDVVAKLEELGVDPSRESRRDFAERQRRDIESFKKAAETGRIPKLD